MGNAAHRDRSAGGTFYSLPPLFFRGFFHWHRFIGGGLHWCCHIEFSFSTLSDRC
jgi:hypothetical protein